MALQKVFLIWNLNFHELAWNHVFFPHTQFTKPAELQNIVYKTKVLLEASVGRSSPERICMSLHWDLDLFALLFQVVSQPQVTFGFKWELPLPVTQLHCRDIDTCVTFLNGVTIRSALSRSWLENFKYFYSAAAPTIVLKRMSFEVHLVTYEVTYKSELLLQQTTQVTQRILVLSIPVGVQEFSLAVTDA